MMVLILITDLSDDEEYEKFHRLFKILLVQQKNCIFLTKMEFLKMMDVVTLNLYHKFQIIAKRDIDWQKRRLVHVTVRPFVETSVVLGDIGEEIPLDYFLKKSHWQQ